ncbi:RNA demethylase ALKBH10B-like isoform X4 [Rhododendron vialii]|nr:RNA demethylase ALKBH10B-like isoform X4 [Rhododendron vialii]
MQKYHSVADVTLELGRVAAAKKVGDRVEGGEVKRSEEMKGLENEEGRSLVDCEEESVDEDSTRDDSPNSEVTGTGKTLSQKVQPPLGNKGFCSNHEECEARGAQIKKTKGFTAKEYVKGHMTNVVSGLKLFEDVFTDLELSKLNDFVDELQVAGQNGELSGETYILFNQQIKGEKRELIQFGTPIFGQIKEDAKPKDGNVHIESIPTLLQAVIDHLVQWHLISENRKPNSCIINFFDEGEFSQPFLKPPHLEQPISTLLLSESMMAFGQTLESDSDGNYKGPLMLSLKEGSLLVLRGNSSDLARHVMCPSPNKRVSITFFKVRSDTSQNTALPPPPLSQAMTIWHPGVPTSHAIPNGALNRYEAMHAIPKWGILRAPIVMLAPMQPMVLSPRRVPHSGTGVFLPWTLRSRKSPKYLPPRAKKAKLLLTLPPSVEAKVADPSSDPGIGIEAKMV